jgi:adenylate cyclase
MSDVFISYARADEALARRLAGALREHHYGVWLDDELPAHRAYADVIEERLKSAKAVIVLWSAEAAKSQWVRSEADAARQLGTLVQAAIDGTMPPMPFDQIQCADLNGWKGGSAPGWSKLVASVAALAGQPDKADTSGPQRSRVSVCVLPFVNMSGDAEQEYFSDGISEDITTDLSKVSALEVIARNTAFQFKSQSVDVCDIARKLGVSHVLEGSVRKAGSRVRITAQLIDGKTGGHVWADRYDRDLTDIFAIQDEISHAIVNALKLKLLPEEKKAIENRGTSSAEAYNLYLMARQFWVSGNYGDPRRDERVIRICKRALDVDPNYARAWALMALAQADLRFGFARLEETALDAAEKALEIDPRIAEAHCVKARYLSDQGKTEEADAEIEIALGLDPDSWEANKEAARQSMLHRRIPEATRYLEKAAALLDSDFHSWGLLITCYRSIGDKERVLHAVRVLLEKCERALGEDPSNGTALGMFAAGLAMIGEKDRAREWIDRALLLDPDNANSRYNFACVVANDLDDPEAAVDLLESAFALAGQAMIRAAEADPDFDVIRDHPRFVKALSDAKERLGLAKRPAATPAAAT